MSPSLSFVGLRRFPVYRQPDAYSCGAACLRMVCTHLEFHRALDVQAIARMAGTNPLTGTTEVEMQRGLEGLGLSWERPAGTGTAYLRQVIASGNVVLLRTLLPGNKVQPEGFKHWVVVHGADAKGFLIACSGAGATRWTETFTDRVWGARDYDHFVVPAARSRHRRALAWERRELRQRWRPVHEMTLPEFLTDVPTIPDHELRAWHDRAINEAAAAIRIMGAKRLGDEMAYGSAEGFSFRAIPRQGATWDMAVIEQESGQTAGGIARGTRWVDPAFRGQGLGAEIALAAHSEPERRFLLPSSYSESGYASRVAAHRLAVERALAQGLEVPQRVLDSLDHEKLHITDNALAERRDEGEDSPQYRLL